MDPVTMIGLASGVLKATGLGEKIGSWIGGESGGKAAGKILDTAQVVTGSRSPEEALEALRADAKMQGELRQALIKQETEILKLHLEDIQSARDMQISALQSGNLFAANFIYWMALFWSVVGAAYMFGITFFPVPEESQRFADTALGFILGTIIAQILGFFFGSSQGSADKTRVMKEQLLKLMTRG